MIIPIDLYSLHIIFILIFSLQFQSTGTTLSPNNSITRVAFGSCNDQKYQNHMFKAIQHYPSDIWLWLGDVVYLDKKKYPLIPLLSVPLPTNQTKPIFSNLKHNEDYQSMIKDRVVLGIWDDHDFNCNNGGSHCHSQETEDQMKRQFLDFLGEPDDSPRRKHRGIYDVFTFEERLKIFLLDVRTFRETPSFSSLGPDILGEAQWLWLERELASSKAQVHIFASGFQFLPDDTLLIEKWFNFPSSQNRLFGLLRKYQIPGIVFLSGDVHFGQILENRCFSPLPEVTLFEITSSGLTHSCETLYAFGLCQTAQKLFHSRYQTDAYYEYNFGTLEIDWSAQKIHAGIRGQDGQLAISKELSFEQISFKSDTSPRNEPSSLSLSPVRSECLPMPLLAYLSPEELIFIFFPLLFCCIIFCLLLLCYLLCIRTRRFIPVKLKKS